MISLSLNPLPTENSVAAWGPIPISSPASPPLPSSPILSSHFPKTNANTPPTSSNLHAPISHSLQGNGNQHPAQPLAVHRPPSPFRPSQVSSSHDPMIQIPTVNPIGKPEPKMRTPEALMNTKYARPEEDDPKTLKKTVLRIYDKSELHRDPVALGRCFASS